MNIEILIQGTKGGAKTFYSTNPMGPESVFYRFAGDMRRSDSNGVTDWEAYSVALAGSGCIFSKYIGIYDMGRQFGGNVSFSAYLPNSCRLEGADLIALLDTLAATYKERYAPDGKLGNADEDWNFVHELAATYEDKLKFAQGGNRFMEAGTNAPAFAYYSNSAELELFLNYPFQEAYRTYRQVFLIGKDYKDNINNPLGQLNHNPANDLTGKIEFNTTYILRNFNSNAKGGVTISLRKDNRQLKEGDTIKSQDILQLGYYRDFYIPIEVEGTVNDTSMASYLIVNGNLISVRDNDISLQPEQKTISLIIQNFNHEDETRGVEIVCFRNNVSKAQQEDGKLTFSGEEIGIEWTIRASKKNVGEVQQRITPANTNGSLRLTLHLSKIIKFEVRDRDGRKLNNRCRIRIWKEGAGAYIDLKTPIYEFQDNNINDNFCIVIECEGYQKYSTTFTPKKCDDTETFILQRDPNYRQTETTTSDPIQSNDKRNPPVATNKNTYYDIYIDKKAFKGSYDNTFPNGNTPFFEPKPRTGYRFTGWKTENYQDPIGACKGRHTAGYEDLWWHKNRIPLAIIFLIVIATVLAIIFFKPHHRQTETITIEYIETFVRGQYGDNIDSLHALEERYIAQKNNIDSIEFNKGMELINDKKNTIIEKENKERLIAEIEDYLADTDLKPDQLRKYKEKANNIKLDESLIQKIDKAILLRDTLGGGYITYIIEKMNYPFNEKQKPLVDVLNKTSKQDSTRQHVAEIIIEDKDKIKNMSLLEVADFIDSLVDAYKNPSSKKQISPKSYPSEDRQTKEEQAIKDFWALVSDDNATAPQFISLKKNNYLHNDYKEFIKEITGGKNNNNFNYYKNIPQRSRNRIVNEKPPRLGKLQKEYNIIKNN